MDTRLLTVGNRLLAADSYGIFLCLNLQVVFVNTWQFDHRDEIVVLLKDVDRRETAARCRAAAYPVARNARFQGTLQGQQCFEWVAEGCKHRFPPYLVFKRQISNASLDLVSAMRTNLRRPHCVAGSSLDKGPRS